MDEPYKVPRWAKNPGCAGSGEEVNSRIKVPQGGSPDRVSLLLHIELLSEHDLRSKALQCYTNKEASQAGKFWVIL